MRGISNFSDLLFLIGDHTGNITAGSNLIFIHKFLKEHERTSGWQISCAMEALIYRILFSVFISEVQQILLFSNFHLRKYITDV